MTIKEKRTINELFQSLATKKMSASFVKVLAETAGTSATAAQKFLSKNGHLPAPSVNDLTKLVLQNPELAKLMEGFSPEVLVQTVSPQGGMVATVSSSNGFGIFGAIPSGELSEGITANNPTASTSSTKKKKKNKKKKNANKSSTKEDAGVSSMGLGKVLKPRNFLEAALYFSNITMSTVEMAMDLEPEYFFAPPLLFKGSENTASWLEGLKKRPAEGKGQGGVFEFEQHKAIQRKMTGLFAVALLQSSSNSMKNHSYYNSNIGNFGIGNDRSVSIRSNYLKRTIGLYAISLVDHLPPTLSDRFSDQKSINTNFGHPYGNLLTNRKVELSDLKVPSAQQLSDFWAGLDNAEKVLVLRGEQSMLQKGWINLKKSWCFCKYCRMRDLRISDIFELTYRSYYDDLEHVINEIEKESQTSSTKRSNSNPSTIPEVQAIKPKTKRHLFKCLSILADDIINERSSYLTMVLKRIGKAFEDDCSWDFHEHLHGDEVCHNCHGVLTDKRSGKTNRAAANEEEFSDSEDERDNLSDSWDEEDLESFYEDFNLMEDEELIQAECELPIDVNHLSTTFPPLYDPRMYTMPLPNVPAYSINSELDRISDGEALYEHFISLIFQFHLVPKYLEAEALARQRRLLEEEEEREKLEKLKKEQKMLAKQRKRERMKAAKQKDQKEEQLSTSTEIVQEEVSLTNDTGEPDEDGDIKVDEPFETTVEIIEASVAENPTDVEAENDGDDDEGVIIATADQIDEGLEDPPGLTDIEDKPPGLSTFPLTGEAPPDLPSSWFDKILSGPLTEPSLIWSPFATWRSSDDAPPGFQDGPNWSPF